MKALSALGTKFRAKDDDTLRKEIEAFRASRRVFTREHLRAFRQFL